jgi:hypothetical protein
MMKSVKLKIDTQHISPIPPDMIDLPKGWLSHFDAGVLYSISKILPDNGSILEIGSWIGRSSCSIAVGVRDSIHKNLRFDIIDYGITGDREWENRFGSSVFLQKDASQMCEVVFKYGGTGAVLKQNLVDRDLARFVRLLILGDFLDYSTDLKYDFIFCDATHGEEEIARNIPAIKKLMKEDSILVCDDIVSDHDADLVARLWGARCHYLTAETHEYSKMGIFIKGDIDISALSTLNTESIHF